MLTSDDLQKIKSIVDTSVDQKLDQKFKKELTPIKKALRKLNQKTDLIISSFDRDHTTLRKRVDRIETHLNLPPVTSN